MGDECQTSVLEHGFPASSDLSPLNFVIFSNTAPKNSYTQHPGRTHKSDMEILSRLLRRGLQCPEPTLAAICKNLVLYVHNSQFELLDTSWSPFDSVKRISGV